MAIETSGIAISGDTSPTYRETATNIQTLSTDWRVRVYDNIVDVETAWTTLEAGGIESPGQSYEFVKIWVESFEKPHDRQCYVVVEHGEVPILVLSMERRRRFGLELLTPFAQCHVGTNAPVMNVDFIASLDGATKTAMWKEIVRKLGADLVVFPDMLSELVHVFGETGTSIRSETLYRTAFDSWDACDKQQRTRSRRKHDKQQGAKLAAMGEVTFEELDSADVADAALDKMFVHRASRFEIQGIKDPFGSPEVRAFYRSIFARGDRIRGKMHVLRLNNEIIASRYNLVMGDKMFCLISSMDTDQKLQPGSPGKQTLLRIMQSVFAQGTGVFDMGAGFSDEKRHWCNVQIPLSNVYLARTVPGYILSQWMMLVAKTKVHAKSNKAVFDAFKTLRARLADAKSKYKSKIAR